MPVKTVNLTVDITVFTPGTVQLVSMQAGVRQAVKYLAATARPKHGSGATVSKVRLYQQYPFCLFRGKDQMRINVSIFILKNRGTIPSLIGFPKKKNIFCDF